MKQIVLFIAIFTIFSCKEKRSGGSAKVIFVKGEAYIAGKKAKLGDVVRLGQTLRTSADSALSVVFDEKNIIYLKEQTSVRFSDNLKGKLVNVQRGYIAAILRNKKTAADYRFRTTTFTAGVRGTVLFLGAPERDAGYVCACNGKLELNQDGETISLVAHHHAARKFHKKEESISVKKAGLEEHDDALLEKVAAQIHEKINWQQQE